MTVLEQSFSVSFRYAVRFTRDLFDAANPALRDALAGGGRRPRALFVVDAGVIDHHPDLERRVAAYAGAHADAFELSGPVLVVPGGEVVKRDPAFVQAVLDRVDADGIDRHSFVVAVGGGAVLDAVGFAAGIAHRGVRLVRVPTTVLSQNDSGVGVKNGVNAFAKKNFLGTFAPPTAVLCDLNFLHSLDARDWRAGISEAVKVALIKDAAFFESLERDAASLARRDDAAMERLVVRCAELHLAHIAGGDPFELGSARPLDFGHWAAHKLEALSEYRLRHGEAVAIGIALDTVYSRLAGHLSAAACERVLAVLEAVGFELWAPELAAHLDDADHPRGVLRGLEEFREHLGGQLSVTLLSGVGQGFEAHEMSVALVRAAVNELRERAGEPALAAD